VRLVKQLPTSWPCRAAGHLIFFDTTSTYFETEAAEEPVWRDPHGRVLDSGETAARTSRGQDSQTGLPTERCLTKH
jgi:hypothetical protein